MHMCMCMYMSQVPTGYISVPQPVEFPSPLGTSYGFYYPPCHPSCESDEDAPPLLVKAHGGPTACTSASFNPGIQFFTSRGFAVLDVDYGGSTGYGRDYRRRLRGNWGVVDIDDVCAGAKYVPPPPRRHQQHPRRTGHAPAQHSPRLPTPERSNSRPLPT